jgi:hypothetical protein
VDPERVNNEANRAGGADKYRGFGDDRREILLAEGLAAAPWSDAGRSESSVRGAIAVSYASLHLEPPETLTPERVGEVRAALARLGSRWRSFGKTKGTLTLLFYPEDPERGFKELLSES